MLDRFNDSVLLHYAFDRCSQAEKIRYLRKNPTFRPQLFVPDTNIIVLGDGIYDPPATPIGRDKTAVDAWRSNLLKKFVDKKTEIYGTMTGDKLALSNITEKDGTYARSSEGTKRFVPTVCGTGKNTVASMKGLAKQLDKHHEGVLEDKTVKIKNITCLYLEMFMREENGCFWITPEESSVIRSKEVSHIIRDELKAKK
jgi:hypothetical protein